MGPLQTNLMAIFNALHDEEASHNLPLSASSPSTVYYRNNWYGLIKDQFNTQSYILSGVIENILKSFDETVRQIYLSRQLRIWNNMLQIKEISKKESSSLELLDQRERVKKMVLEEDAEYGERYLEAFSKRSHCLLTEEKMQEHRHQIVNFYQATDNFWPLFIYGSPICSPLQSYIPKPSTLLDATLFKVLQKEKEWVQMEGAMDRPIPVALISKLQSLTLEEKRELKSWVKELNKSSLSFDLVSNVLKEIIQVIHLEGSSTLTLQDFIFWLDQQGCKFLYCEDNPHMDWREKLKEGDIVACNGKPFTLGRQLSPGKAINDEFKIFELENHPDYVIKIANNSFSLLIEDKQSHWGVRLVEKIKNIEIDPLKPPVDGLDKRGRCVILEKLSFSFDTISWDSQEGELTKKDRKLAMVLANHLFCMKEWNASSENFSLAHLMWDINGDLKSTRPLKKGLPNYNQWESLCIEAAKGNTAVLSYLMHVSKLTEHKIAKYYREAVEYTLKNGKTDLLSRPLPNGHDFEIYTERVKELCEKALKLRKACLDHVIAYLRKRGLYSHDKETALQKEVAERMVRSYKASCTPGQLPSNWEEEIVRSYSHFADWEATLSAYFNCSKYYRQQHELMMGRNLAAMK